MNTRTLVAVVDDDESVRESLPDLLRELGFSVRAFASADEFLAAEGIADVRCLILDIGLPKISGPALERELVRQGRPIPTIFITGRAERSIPPELLERGRFECLFKPFSEQELRAALDSALE